MGCCCFSGLHSARIIAEIRTFVLLCSTSSSWSGDSGAHDSVLVTVMDFPDKYTVYILGAGKDGRGVAGSV